MSFIVEKNTFFEGLNGEELTVVRQCMKERNIKKGEALCAEGELCSGVFFVKSGSVKIFRNSVSGREQVLETLAPADSCICNPGQGDWRCLSAAEAMTDSSIWHISRENFVHLVQTQPKLSHALNRIFAQKLKRLGTLIGDVSLKDSRARLVKLLLDLAEGQKIEGVKKETITIPYTREEIARRIGVVRETVIRQLNELRRLKLIDIKLHKFSVLDVEGLKKIAG